MLTGSQDQKKEGEGRRSRAISSKMPLSERIMKKIATMTIVLGMAIAANACTLQRDGITVSEDAGPRDANGQDADVDLDGSRDTDVDLDGGNEADVDRDSGQHDADTDEGGVADADIDDGGIADAEADLDGGETDSDLDGGPDADADVDMDGGDLDADVEEDGGSDGGTDADVDDGGMADADMDDAGPVVCGSITDGSLTSETVNTGEYRDVGGYRFTNTGEDGTGIRINISCNLGTDVIEIGIYCESGGPETIVDRPDEGKRIRILNHGSNEYFANLTINVEDPP